MGSLGKSALGNSANEPISYNKAHRPLAFVTRSSDGGSPCPSSRATDTGGGSTAHHLVPLIQAVEVLPIISCHWYRRWKYCQSSRATDTGGGSTADHLVPLIQAVEVLPIISCHWYGRWKYCPSSRATDTDGGSTSHHLVTLIQAAEVLPIISCHCQIIRCCTYCIPTYDNDFVCSPARY